VDRSSLTGVFVKFWRAAAHRLQLAIRERAVIEARCVVGLAHDRLQLAGVTGVAQGIELVAAGGIGWLPVGRKVSICKHRPHSSNNLIKFVRRYFTLTGFVLTHPT
jgi:hypothetical protein